MDSLFSGAGNPVFCNNEIPQLLTRLCPFLPIRNRDLFLIFLRAGIYSLIIYFVITDGKLAK